MTASSVVRLLWGTCLALSLQISALQAAVITADGTICTLGNAILAANTDAAFAGCTSGAGADTVILGANVVLTAPVTAGIEGGPSGLPAISTEVTITSGGAANTVERSSALACSAADPAAFRILEVASGGHLVLSGLILRNGCIAASSPGEVASGGAVLVESGGSLSVEGCDILNNTAQGAPAGVDPPGAARGGAVAVLGGAVQISNAIFRDNSALGADARGGAVAVEAGEVGEISWSQFEGNRASPIPFGGTSTPTSGGAISLRATATGTLAHLEVVGNLAGPESPGLGGSATGGGMAVSGGRIREMREMLFSANVARAGSFSILQGTAAQGGGLANGGVIDTILQCSFVANQALGYSLGEGRGGGLDNTGWIGRIVAASFLSNNAEGGLGVHAVQGPSLGGGIANLGSIAELAASSVVGNTCPDLSFISLSAGGGIYNASDDVLADGGLQLVDTLLAGNIATIGADCRSTATLTSLGFNLARTPDSSCTFTSMGDIVGEDPLTLPPGANGCAIALPGGGCLPMVALSSGSPAVDAGLCNVPGTEVDARGAVRPFDVAGVPNAPGGDGCDIGAFELDGALATVHLGLSVAESVDPVASGSGVGNLVYTVSLASLGSATATGIAVAGVLPLPTGVTLDSVTPSAGSWDGANWTVPALPSGAHATLTFVLTVGFGTAGAPDALSLSAAVTAATGHSGEFATDVETTSVIEGVFFDGFESGDTSAWSLTVGGS